MITCIQVIVIVQKEPCYTNGYGSGFGLTVPWIAIFLYGKWPKMARCRPFGFIRHRHGA